MSEQRIDPGEGWRLLEPGEVIRVGDQWSNKIHFPKWVDTICSGSIIDAHQHDVYRRPIEPAASSPWIAVSEKPLPESGEALVEYSNGLRVHWSDVSVMGEGRHDVVAYQLVEPFATPEPEKPKRRKWHLLWCSSDGGRTHGWEVFSDVPCPTESYVPVVEVLPGDVAPDAARKAREYAERNLGVGHTFAARDILEILNGGQP